MGNRSFLADPRVKESVVGSTPVEHLHYAKGIFEGQEQCLHSRLWSVLVPRPVIESWQKIKHA